MNKKIFLTLAILSFPFQVVHSFDYTSLGLVCEEKIIEQNYGTGAEPQATTVCTTHPKDYDLVTFEKRKKLDLISASLALSPWRPTNNSGLQPIPTNSPTQSTRMKEKCDDSIGNPINFALGYKSELVTDFISGGLPHWR